MNRKLALVLLPFTFPYYSGEAATENSFLQVEVQYLAQTFDPFIIAPCSIKENKISLPAGIEIDTSYAAVNKVPSRNQLLHILREPLFISEILSHPRLLLKPEAIRTLVKRTYRVFATRDWVINLFQRHNLDPENTLFYTYWLGYTTLGVGLARQKLPGIVLVSRVHGGDLYPDRGAYNTLFYQVQALRHLDHLFVISEHGREYLASAYPWVGDLSEVSRLGIRTHNSLNLGSSDGVFRIASCSSVTPVKRVHLLVLGIAQASLKQPDQRFEWNHFGSGFLIDEIRLIAEQKLPANVSWQLQGNLPNEDVMRYYQNNPVDLFVNVSSSEGIPVSIMEAASFGIPIMATAVGGTPEVVSEKNGWLLSPDASPDEISTALLKLVKEPQFRVQAGVSSRLVWEQSFDADRNYPQFVSRLKNIRHG